MTKVGSPAASNFEMPTVNVRVRVDGNFTMVRIVPDNDVPPAVSGHTHALRNGRRRSGRLDRNVRSTITGQGMNLVNCRLVIGCVDMQHVIRSELLGNLQSIGMSIDDDHSGGTGQSSQHGHIQPHRPASLNRHAIAQPNFRSINRMNRSGQAQPAAIKFSAATSLGSRIIFTPGLR